MFNGHRAADHLSNNAGMDSTGTYLYNQNIGSGFGAATGETTSTADGKMWLTDSAGGATGINAAAASGRIWLVADLGASYTLNTITIWNFQWQNGTLASGNLSNRGVSQFDLLVRDTAFDTSDGLIGGTPLNVRNGGVATAPPATATTGTGTVSDDAVFSLGTVDPWSLAISNQSLAQAPNLDTYTGETFTFAANATARFVAIRVDSYYGGAGVGLGKVRIDGVPEPAPACLGSLGLLGLLRRRR